MAEYLINFVNHLDPNGRSLQHWPMYNASNPQVLTFLDGIKPLSITTDDYRKDQMEFISQMSLKYPM